MLYLYNTCSLNCLYLLLLFEIFDDFEAFIRRNAQDLVVIHVIVRKEGIGFMFSFHQRDIELLTVRQSDLIDARTATDHDLFLGIPVFFHGQRGSDEVL